MVRSPINIFSWNILHGGGRRIEDIQATVASHQPDIVCLQEFRHGKTKAALTEGLARQGLLHSYSPPPESNVKNTVAVFSRLPFTGSTLVPGDSGNVRVIEMKVTVDVDESLRVIAVSFPHKKKQLPVFDVLLDLPPDYLALDTVIIGDFNCGIPFEDSQTRTFYATHQFQALLKQGWIDVWRSRNPTAREYTWFSTHKGNGFRYDHALASPSLDQRVVTVDYDHEAREQGVSDHSSLRLTIN